MTDVPSLPWPEFLARFDWRQGDHVALIGPSGSGKTTAVLDLLSRRRYAVALATKPEDDTLDRFALEQGYDRLEEWSNDSPWESPRRMLWPDARSLRSTDGQRREFEYALDCIFRQGGWTVYWDDLPYFIKRLKMSDTVVQYLFQARSIGLSVVLSGQRPVNVPREIWGSQHLFLWRVNDRQDLRRLGEIGGVDTGAVTDAVRSLAEFELLYINTRARAMCRTMVTRPAALELAP